MQTTYPTFTKALQKFHQQNAFSTCTTFGMWISIDFTWESVTKWIFVLLLIKMKTFFFIALNCNRNARNAHLRICIKVLNTCTYMNDQLLWSLISRNRSKFVCNQTLFNRELWKWEKKQQQLSDLKRNWNWKNSYRSISLEIHILVSDSDHVYPNNDRYSNLNKMSFNELYTEYNNNNNNNNNIRLLLELKMNQWVALCQCGQCTCYTRFYLIQNNK